MNSAICSDCNSATGEQKRHKHIWMYSTYCDTCDCDFDTWLQEERETVVRDIILWDLNHLLARMHREDKIDQKALLEIHTRIRELARFRGYLRPPWDKEQQQEEGNDSL